MGALVASDSADMSEMDAGPAIGGHDTMVTRMIIPGGDGPPLARSTLRAHGDEIAPANLPQGGLAVRRTLPFDGGKDMTNALFNPRRLTMKKMTLAWLTLTAWPASAMADPGDAWADGYGHMMGGWGYGLFGPLMMLVYWGVIIALIVVVVRWLSDNRGQAGRKDAMDILRERFAAGEIDEEEFNRRKRALEG